MTKIVFLDIDGVLNNAGLPAGPEPRAMFDPRNIGPFNRIIRETKAKVVISSTWRSMIQPDFMTHKGFEMMLLTHRIRCEVVGFTPQTEGLRGDQIAAWLAAEIPGVAGQFVALDDDDDGIANGHPSVQLIQTDGSTGLTEADADRAIKMLVRGPARSAPYLDEVPR